MTIATGSTLVDGPGASRAQLRRLRELWRSAGWPCHDDLELSLLNAGWVSRHFDVQGRETLRVTDTGLRQMGEARQRNQRAFAAHEALVEQVARQLRAEGRVVWRGLSLRAGLPMAGAPMPAGPGSVAALMAEGWHAEAPMVQAVATPGAMRWVQAMPDLFSIRHTTVEDYLEPAVHEVKVSRADLLADLRRPDKGAAYRALAARCWYVLRRGIGDADDVPIDYGVLLADAGGLEVQRAAPTRPMRLPFASWMALARARAEGPDDDDAAQSPLVPRGPDALS